MTAPSDGFLAQRAAEGDLRAFDALVRRHQLRTYRLCFHMLGDRPAAEDAAQDTFFTAWRAIGRYEGRSRFSTWLYRIAVNRCLKDLKGRPPTTARSDLLGELGDPTGTPEEHYEAKERLDAVAAAINRLPSEQRLVLLLRDVEALTYGEIIDVLGVPMATVKTRIYRARLHLARELDQR